LLTILVASEAMLKHIVGKFRANRYDGSHTSTVILNEKLIACTTAQLHESFVSRRVQNCLSPLKLCHNLLETEDRNYGSEALFGRRYFEAVTRD